MTFTKEELTDRFEEISDSTTESHSEGGACLNLAKMSYLDFNFKYIFAAGESPYENIKLGGLRVGIEIGIHFKG